MRCGDICCGEYQKSWDAIEMDKLKDRGEQMIAEVIKSKFYVSLQIGCLCMEGKNQPIQRRESRPNNHNTHPSGKCLSSGFFKDYLLKCQPRIFNVSHLWSFQLFPEPFLKVWNTSAARRLVGMIKECASSLQNHYLPYQSPHHHIFSGLKYFEVKW